MNTAELQFNIIYTPYTARYLSMFVPSLLEWMDCRFRIVANGCLPEEVDALKALCETSDRLEFLMMSEEGMIQHGHALNWLHERTNSPWFCYMDSDIIATGPFMEQVAACLDNCDVFSSGLPLWANDEDSVLPRSFRRMQGSHIRTGDGTCIACDFFAIFDNRKLTDLMQRTGIGFQTYGWDEIPAEQQKILRETGMDKLDYDSGKVLTCLLLHEGACYTYEDLPHLRHLGGFSEKAGEGAAFFYRGKLDRLAVNLAGGRLARPLFYLADIWYGMTRPPVGLDSDEHAQMPLAEKRIFASRNRKRLNTARYFNVMLHAAIDGVTKPDYPVLGDKQAEERLVAAAESIRAIVSKHHPNAAF